MAIVQKFERVRKDRVGSAKGTDCGYTMVELDGTSYLLVESYGSSDRRRPGKVSQSLHLDRAHAAELKSILEKAFPGI